MLTNAEDDGSETLVLATFIDRCQQYPEDAVATACREWADTEKFWPSLAELVAQLNLLTMRRRALLVALERGYQPPPQPDPERSPPSEADTRHVTAAMNELRGRIGAQPRPRVIERPPIPEEGRRQMERELAAHRAKLAQLRGE